MDNVEGMSTGDEGRDGKENGQDRSGTGETGGERSAARPVGAGRLG